LASSPDDDGGAANNTIDAPAAEAEVDTSTPPDAAEEWRGDDGVPDANAGEVGADATGADSSAEDASDATPVDSRLDRIADAPRDDATLRTPDAPANAGCDAGIDFYRDRDKDGFGSTSEHVLACSPPPDDTDAWVTAPGDCRDDLPDVKPFKMGSPDPPMYSGVGYSDPLRPQGISFDFDCNGVETADPTNTYGAAPATCPALSTNCGAIGYISAAPARNGTGVDGLCGSTTLRICAAEGLNCNPKYAQTTPFRCR
jgi:hypothetical protein